MLDKSWKSRTIRRGGSCNFPTSSHRLADAEGNSVLVFPTISSRISEIESRGPYRYRSFSLEIRIASKPGLPVVRSTVRRVPLPSDNVFPRLDGGNCGWKLTYRVPVISSDPCRGSEANFQKHLVIYRPFFRTRGTRKYNGKFDDSSRTLLRDRTALRIW